jgi:BMFP domain-containing protein YqiC
VGAAVVLLLEASLGAAQDLSAVPASPPRPVPAAPAQSALDALATRVAALEQRLTALETRVSNDEAAVQVSSTGDDGGLSKATATRLASLEARVRALEAAAGKSAKSGEAATRVTAPFEVVDSHGIVIMSVEGNDLAGKDLASGVRIAGLNGQWISLGPNADGLLGIHVYGAESTGSARVALGIHADGSGGLRIANQAHFTVWLNSTASGEGEAQFANASGKVVASIGAFPTTGAGHAVFSNAAGDWLLKLGADGARGDALLRGDGNAFDLWDSLVLDRLPFNP